MELGPVQSEVVYFVPELMYFSVDINSVTCQNTIVGKVIEYRSRIPDFVRVM